MTVVVPVRAMKRSSIGPVGRASTIHCCSRSAKSRCHAVLAGPGPLNKAAARMHLLLLLLLLAHPWTAVCFVHANDVPNRPVTACPSLVTVRSFAHCSQMTWPGRPSTTQQVQCPARLFPTRLLHRVCYHWSLSTSNAHYYGSLPLIPMHAHEWRPTAS